MKRELTMEVQEQFKWLVSEMKFVCTVRQYENVSFIHSVEYIKNNSIIITFICDDREKTLDFQILIESLNNNYCITEFLGNKVLYYEKKRLKQLRYERIFNYTDFDLSEEKFQESKMNILKQPRIDIEKLVSLYNELIMTALKSIQLRLLKSCKADML